MIFLEAPSAECWKMQVDMASGRNSRDIDTVVVIINNSDVCMTEACANDAGKTGQTIKGPNTGGHIDPSLVAPLLLVAVEDV